MKRILLIAALLILAFALPIRAALISGSGDVIRIVGAGRIDTDGTITSDNGIRSVDHVALSGVYEVFFDSITPSDHALCLTAPTNENAVIGVGVGNDVDGAIQCSVAIIDRATGAAFDTAFRIVAITY